mmetsp:Transcript_62497/g.135785  ORF Transcript_62497/g.135785 Transcript_62497/m.135785 type:complete len:204 (+) Transcript_62497:67-678(+)
MSITMHKWVEFAGDHTSAVCDSSSICRLIFCLIRRWRCCRRRRTKNNHSVNLVVLWRENVGGLGKSRLDMRPVQLSIGARHQRNPLFRSPLPPFRTNQRKAFPARVVVAVAIRVAVGVAVAVGVVGVGVRVAIPTLVPIAIAVAVAISIAVAVAVPVAVAIGVTVAIGVSVAVGVSVVVAVWDAGADTIEIAIRPRPHRHKQT